MELFSEWPFPAAVAVLFAIVMARANLTYWAGRAVRTGADRTGGDADDPDAAPRFARRVASAAVTSVRRAEGWINRWGPIAVTVSFLTIGIQTAINFTAGATRMPLRRYLPAVIAGCVLWALIYATVGVVTVEGLIRLYEVSPPVFAVVVIVGPLAVAALVVRGIRERRAGRIPTG